MREKGNATDQGGDIGGQHGRDGTTPAMTPRISLTKTEKRGLLRLISVHGDSTLSGLKEFP
jgi:hypothetical protein